MTSSGAPDETFSRGYSTVTEFEKIAFFVSLIATAFSSALLTEGIATAASIVTRSRAR